MRSVSRSTQLDSLMILVINLWKTIIEIMKKQKTDPGYQFVAELPAK
jgi:hypothetical protein